MTPRMDYLQRYAVARKTALHVTIMQSGDRLGRQVGEQRISACYLLSGNAQVDSGLARWYFLCCGHH